MNASAREHTLSWSFTILAELRGAINGWLARSGTRPPPDLVLLQEQGEPAADRVGPHRRTGRREVAVADRVVEQGTARRSLTLPLLGNHQVQVRVDEILDRVEEGHP